MSKIGSPKISSELMNHFTMPGFSLNMTISVAQTKPSSMLPASPMKMLAGLKLYGRKPIAAPNSAIEMMMIRVLNW